MKESFSPRIEKDSAFVSPNPLLELGEIERIAKTFGYTNEKTFISEFVQRAKKGTLVSLNETDWSALENTDSYSEITLGDWEAVENQMKNYGRQGFIEKKEAMEQGAPKDAPIIMRKGNLLHLVAGNTRLMMCRAMGITPKVLIVDMTDYQDNP